MEQENKPLVLKAAELHRANPGMSMAEACRQVGLKSAQNLVRYYKTQNKTEKTK